VNGRRFRADANTEQNSARHTESALPDLHDVPRRIGKAFPLGGDVIQPRPDHTGRHGPHEDGGRVIGPTDTEVREAATEYPRRHDDADGDHQTVRAEL